jgi:hypothetical protein
LSRWYGVITALAALSTVAFLAVAALGHFSWALWMVCVGLDGAWLGFWQAARRQ